MARHFTNWIDAYVEHTRLAEAPTVFHFWTAVSSIAGALRRRVWIDQLHFKWFANFYIVLVAPAGIIAKSTSIGPGMRILSKVPDITMGPRSVTWQRLAQTLAAASQEVTIPLPNDKFDIVTMSPVTIALSELGTFLKTDDRTMMDVLTDLWDSPEGVWTHSTITSGETNIENPWVNILACTVPSWIRDNFPERMIGGGFASRVLFIYADQKRSLIPYPSLLVEAANYKSMESKLIEDLTEISKLKGPYTLTADAVKWGIEWYKKHWTNERPLHMASDRYSAYIARKQTHMHKLSIVLAAARRNDLIIDRSDLEEALALIESIEPSMQKVFDSVGQVNEARRLNEMIQFVRTYKVLSGDQLWICVRNIMTKKEFLENLKTGVESGTLRVVMHQGKKSVRLTDETLSSSG